MFFSLKWSKETCIMLKNVYGFPSFLLHKCQEYNFIDVWNPTLAAAWNEIFLSVLARSQESKFFRHFFCQKSFFFFFFLNYCWSWTSISLSHVFPFVHKNHLASYLQTGFLWNKRQAARQTEEIMSQVFFYQATSLYIKEIWSERLAEHQAATEGSIRLKWKVRVC